MLLFPFNHVLAQSFLGAQQHDNLITSVYFNPAFAATDDALQINVFGASGYAGSNAYSYHAGGFSNGGNDFIKNISNGKKGLWGNIDILGPGASFLVKKKYSFAITTRTRTLANVDNLNNGVFRLFGNDVADTIQYRLNDLSVVTQLVSEVNLAYAGYLYTAEGHSLKGGVDVKFLIGSGAAAVGVPDMSFYIPGGNEVSNVNGHLNVDYTPYANQWLSHGNLFSYLGNRTNNFGLGMDMGLVYEYSQGYGMELPKDGYLVRVAASITDIGSINYTASTTSGSYNVKADTFSVGSVDKNPDATYGYNIQKHINDSTFRQTGSDNKFRVGLPTALHLNADIALFSFFYLNTDALINLRKPSADKYASHYVSTFCVTPRFEWKHLGLGIPFYTNAYKQGGFGCIIYLGPLYIGSHSIVALTPSNVDNMDFFAGLALRIKNKKDE